VLFLFNLKNTIAEKITKNKSAPFAASKIIIKIRIANFDENHDLWRSILISIPYRPIKGVIE
jgi:hypothetical protein